MSNVPSPLFGGPVTVQGCQTTTPTEGTFRAIRVDASGRVIVAGGGGAAVDINLSEVDGVDIVSGTTLLSGESFVPIGGATADSTAIEQWPVIIGGGVLAAEPGVVADGRAAYCSLTSTRRLRIAGGDVADNVAASALPPTKIGAVVDEVLALSADGRMVHLVADLYRRLHVRTAGYDALIDAIHVLANTVADDRDEAHQTWADVTDLAANTYYYPAAAGHEIGNRDNFGFQVELADGSFYVEVSNDGAVWIDATANLVDSATGVNGAAVYGGAGVTANYALSWEKCEFRYIRAVWITPNGTNDLELHVFTRAH